MVKFFYRYLSSLFAKKIENSNRIAFVQSAALGDAATLLPFVSAVRNLGFEIHIYCKVGLKSFWQYFISDASITEIDFRTFYENPIEINEKYNAVFCTSLDKKAIYFTSYLKSNRKYGMNEANKGNLIHKLIFNKFHSAGIKEHVYSRFEHLIKLHIPDFKFNSFNYIQPNFVPKSIAIHVGGKWKPRRWQKEKYTELITRLQSQFKEINIITGASESDLFDYFTKQNFNSNVIINYFSNLQELIKIIENSEYFIGNDSGPAHIANLFGKKMLVIWGPGNLDRIKPIGENVKVIFKDIECRPCKQYIQADKCQRGVNLCLTQITVDEVYDEFMEMISK